MSTKPSVTVKAMTCSVSAVIEYALEKLRKDTCRHHKAVAKTIYIGKAAMLQLIDEKSPHLLHYCIGGRWAYFYRGVEVAGTLMEGYPFITLKMPIREAGKSPIYYL